MAVYSLVQSGTITAVAADGAGPKDFTLGTAVKLGTAKVVATVRENRTGDERGATLRLLNTTTVRMEWEGTLAGAETIVAAFFVEDVENLGDDVKEVLYRLTRALGYLGENSIQDKIVADDAGNTIQYRIRVFDSKANAAAATIDTDAALETGEIARVQAVQQVSVSTNDRRVLTRTIDPSELEANPDVG